MLFNTAIISALAAAGIVSAAPSRRTNRGVVAGPFSLQIEALTPHSKIDNYYVVGTHVGAAIDIAVPYTTKQSVYYVNGTNGYVQDAVQYGTLNYNIQAGIPYMGGLAMNTSSNMAPLYLSVIDYQNENTFSLAEDGRVLVGGLSKWFACTTQTAYGPMLAINWLLGNGKPTGPDCESINIRIAA